MRPLTYDETVAVRRELRDCRRVFANADKFSSNTVKLFWAAKQSAEKWHNIYAHPKPFELSCHAYNALIPFPAPTQKDKA